MNVIKANQQTRIQRKLFTIYPFRSLTSSKSFKKKNPIPQVFYYKKLLYGTLQINNAFQHCLLAKLGTKQSSSRLLEIRNQISTVLRFLQTRKNHFRTWNILQAENNMLRHTTLKTNTQNCALGSTADKRHIIAK